MKPCFVMLLSIITLNGFAATRDVWDLQYLPTAGTVYGQSVVNSLNGRIQTDASTTSISGFSFTQTAGYSITDRLLLSLSGEYVDSKFKETGSSEVSKTRGWSDPNLNARFRLMDDRFRVDVLAGGILNTGDARTNDSYLSNNKGGNDFNLNGGPKVYAGIEAGQKSASFQYAILAQVARTMGATDHFAGENENNKAHNDYLLQAFLLNTLAEKVFLKSFASARFRDSHDDYAPLTDLQIGTGGLYAFTPQILADLGVGYRQLNFQTGQVDDLHVWTLHAGARYQF